MAIAIKPLRKFTTGTPTTGDMVEGELAVNTADQKIWVRDGSNNIVEVGNVSAGGGASVSIGISAPSSPSAGDLWWDSTDDDARLKIYFTDATPTSQWVTASPGGGTVAGSNTEIQFNNSDNFGASSNLTWITGTNTLSATNIAGTLTTASQTNITAIGTITTGTLSSGAVLAGVTMTLGSDADGDVYYRSSNILTRLAKGTAAQVLTMNGGATAPIWAAASGGASVTISETAPGGPSAGDLWWDSTDNDAHLKIYYTDATPTSQWVTTTPGGGTVAGSNTEIQFNNSDNFGASSNLTWTTGTNTLSATNIVASGTYTVGGAIVTVSNGDIELAPNGSGVVVFKGDATKGSGQFELNCEQNTHAITIKGPPHSAAASYTLILPNDDGDADQVLKTNGSGVLDWVDQSGGGGGITTGKAIAMAMVFG